MFDSKEYDPEKLLRVSDNLQGLLVVTANEATYDGLYIAISSMELERILHVIGNLSTGLEKNIRAIKEELISALIESSKIRSDSLYPIRYRINIDPRAQIDYSALHHRGFDKYPLGVVRTAEEFYLKRRQLTNSMFI